MTNFEKLKTRIIIAQSIGEDPDYIRVMDFDGGDGRTFYALDGFKGHNLCLSFDHVPTKQEAKEQVKDLYLCGVEWDFDEEMEAI